MGRVYRLGTRSSLLALKQVEEFICRVRKFYPQFMVRVVCIDTVGDKDKSTPLCEVEGSDFFTREIDIALINREIDFAVHSAKDLADQLPKGLKIACITDSVDPYDVFVSKSGMRLENLPYGAVLGTSSKRRKEGLIRYRPDFRIVDIRGNVEERLRLLDESEDIEGIVIAAAGLIRLGLEQRITQRIPFNIIQPHPLQGCLAGVIRDDDKELEELFSCIDSRRGVLSMFKERYGIGGKGFTYER